MELLDECRIAVRVASRSLDSELEMLIADAKRDMERVGVRPELLGEDAMDAMAKSAVVCFVKSHFGLDASPDERAFFEQSYRSHVAALLNSDANSASGGGAA